MARLKILATQRSCFPGMAALLAMLLICSPGARGAQAPMPFQPCRNSVSPQQQIALGQKAAQQVYQQMPILPDSSPVTQYVQALGKKLTQYAPGYKWPFNFHVVDVAEINAFALPGGTVFVNLGAIQAADDEAQLAAVMAHETSHVVLQHSVCNMEKEQRVGLIARIGQMAAGVLMGGGVASGLAQEVIGLGTGLDFLRMSRGAERQADLMGAAILYDAGYDPRAMPQFFETIEGKYGKGGAQFLSDHPNPGNRTEYVDNEIATFPPRTHYVTNSSDFRRIHAMVAGMHAYTSKEVASGVWKHKKPTQTVSTGVNQYDTQAGNSSAVDIAPSQNWTTFHGKGFSMLIPANWKALGDGNSAMVAPPGGIATNSSGQGANLVYGVLTDVYRPPASAPNSDAFTALLDDLTQQNPGLHPGPVTEINIGGVKARDVQSVSPSADNGRGEDDWIVGIPVNGALRYFVFVSPAPDFNRMRPTFQRVLNSIRLE